MGSDARTRPCKYAVTHAQVVSHMKKSNGSAKLASNQISSIVPRESSVTLIDELSIDREYSRKEAGRRTLAHLVEYAAWILSPTWLPCSYEELVSTCPFFCTYLVNTLQDAANMKNFILAAGALRSALTALWDVWSASNGCSKRGERRFGAGDLLTIITAAYLTR